MQEALQASSAKVLENEKSLAHESATLEQATAAQEQGPLAHAKTEAQLEAAESLATERKVLRDEAIVDRDRQAALLGQLQMKCDEKFEQMQKALAEQRAEFERRIESLGDKLTASQQPLLSTGVSLKT